MNRSECAKVLAKIQLGDNRQVDSLTLDEWFDTIGHLEFGDAIAAVRLHRQESDKWLMPAHVVAGAGRARRDRLPLNALEAAARECPMHAGYPLPCLRCEAF